MILLSMSKGTIFSIMTDARLTIISLENLAFLILNISKKGIVNSQDDTVPFGIFILLATIVARPSRLKLTLPLISAGIPV